MNQKKHLWSKVVDIFLNWIGAPYEEDVIARGDTTVITWVY
ncbi:MAG: hypothetical protein AB4352_14995 [Hormoscilla sp.]